MLLVPLAPDADSRLQVRLGANTLALRTYYVPTLAAWCLDIGDTEGATLAAGLVMAPGVNILGASPELTRTRGQFRVFPADGGGNTSDAAIAPLWWFAPGEWEQADTGTVDVSLPFDVVASYSMLPGVPPDLVPLEVLRMTSATSYLYRVVNDLPPARLT